MQRGRRQWWRWEVGWREELAAHRKKEERERERERAVQLDVDV
jgi:hypothetical protein